MVTIEQKLTLFSKLLNQDIKEEASKKMQELEKEYEKRIAENKVQADKEAKEIIDQSKRKAELRKVELISKGKLASKKEFMQIKEEIISSFMKQLDEKVKTFTKTPAYKTYLEKVITGLDDLKNTENKLVIRLTQDDLKENKDFIQKALTAQGLNKEFISFEETDEDILGGLVIEDPVYSTRIDESIRTLIDEAKDEIVEKISRVIGEAGESDHE